jgi:AraC family transcriptional regulator
MSTEAGLLKSDLAIDAHRGETLEAYRVAVERAIAYMKANLAEDFDLDQLARVAAISKYHLVRVFGEMTGISPRYFLACLRIQRAKELLLTSEPTVTEVCFEVGYTSLASFSSSFHELVGMTPEAFRALPRKLTVKQFASAVWGYLASDRNVSGAILEGTVETASASRGFIFVGTFTRGVPQGIPFSGTVLVKPGTFCIERPDLPAFYLMAVLIPFTAKLSTMVATLPVGLVASLRLSNSNPGLEEQPRLRLRPLRATDPPILLALPALPPWRGTFSK